MKKTFLFFVLMAALAMGTKAQGLYIGTAIGYGFKAGSAALSYNYNLDGSESVVKGSLGAGTTPTLTMGYLFTRTIGAEFNIGYLIGQKIPFTNDYSYSSSNFYESNNKIRANSLYINNSIVIRANTSKIIPYAKIGLFIGLLNDVKEKGTYTQTTSSSTIVQSGNYQFSQKGNIATGLSSAFGIDFMLSDKFALFGELTGRLASWSPNSYTSITTPDATGPYIATGSFSTTGQYVNSIPAKYTGPNRISQVMPLSAIGFNIGMKVYLSK
jgi:hypothetical protein